jgi:hypothetical protein
VGKRDFLEMEGDGIYMSSTNKLLSRTYYTLRDFLGYSKGDKA